MGGNLLRQSFSTNPLDAPAGASEMTPGWWIIPMAGVGVKAGHKERDSLVNRFLRLDPPRARIGKVCAGRMRGNHWPALAFLCKTFRTFGPNSLLICGCPMSAGIAGLEIATAAF
jgi:hypothetical protein